MLQNDYWSVYSIATVPLQWMCTPISECANNAQWRTVKTSCSTWHVLIGMCPSVDKSNARLIKFVLAGHGELLNIVTHYCIATILTCAQTWLQRYNTSIGIPSCTETVLQSIVILVLVVQLTNITPLLHWVYWCSDFHWSGTPTLQ